MYSMDGFGRILDKVTDLRGLCKKHTGDDEIRPISVAVPKGLLDELYFRKTVSWLYVLLNETGPFFRFSAKLLRSDQQVSERFKNFKFFVECARTVHAHNLSKDSPSDTRRQRNHDIWLIENGGEPVDWVKCCKSLIVEAEAVLQDILSRFCAICEIEFDRVELWREYADDKRTHWEAHEFDPIIEKAASDLKIEQLNCVLFRNEGKRLEQWRKYAAMFDSRTAAETALERVVREELARIFGMPQI